MSNTSKSAALLLAGMVAGATLGILFSPRKGSENRAKLSNSVKNLGGTAAEKFDTLLGLTGSLVSVLKSDTDMYAQHYDEIEHAII